MNFDRILKAEPTPLTPEEEAEVEEQHRQMQAAMDNCPKKDQHESLTDEDGCWECGYGAK